jgi:translation initiation factor IF-1
VTVQQAQGHPEEGRGTSERTVEGVVTAQQPSGLYQVDVAGARVTAHVGSSGEKNFVRVLVGDRVIVELAARDLKRGRIVKKL